MAERNFNKILNSGNLVVARPYPILELGGKGDQQTYLQTKANIVWQEANIWVISPSMGKVHKHIRVILKQLLIVILNITHPA